MGIAGGVFKTWSKAEVNWQHVLVQILVKKGGYQGQSLGKV